MPKIYSHSKLSTFEQCPLKYKYRYIDQIKPEIEKTIESHLGTCVHDTLEWLYTQSQKNTPTIDNLIKYYAEKWKEKYSPKIAIVRQEFTEKDYFNKGINFLIGYYTKHHPFKDGTFELEKKIVIRLGEHKIQGFIDRLSLNPLTKEYEIHDYKTANFLPSQKKADEDRQLALYSIAIKEIFGQEKKVKLIWHYLAHNTELTSQRTNLQLKLLKQQVHELIKKIESTTYFPTNKSILCNWCEYKEICPEFKCENLNNYSKKEKQKNLNEYSSINKYLKD